MHKDRFKGVGSFGDDVYGGMSKDSSKFLIEARNIESRDENIFSWLLCQYLDLWWESVVSFKVSWSSNVDSYF